MKFYPSAMQLSHSMKIYPSCFLRLWSGFIKTLSFFCLNETISFRQKKNYIHLVQHVNINSNLYVTVSHWKALIQHFILHIRERLSLLSQWYKERFLWQTPIRWFPRGTSAWGTWASKGRRRPRNFSSKNSYLPRLQLRRNPSPWQKRTCSQISPMMSSSALSGERLMPDKGPTL